MDGGRLKHGRLHNPEKGPDIAPDRAFSLPDFFSELLSILFPVRCVHCGRPGGWLCPECLAALRPLGEPACSRCGRPARSGEEACNRSHGCRECRGRELHFASARAAFAFTGPARSLVHRLKYSGQRRLADYMAGLASDRARLTTPPKAVTLTYVPLHSSKLVSRGYNQAGLFARALSRSLGLPLRELLCKQHLTQPQNQLGYDERLRNPEGSFALRDGLGRTARSATAGDRILLVDDVYTTGSTVSECARVLSEGLGMEVHVWTFARTVKTGTAQSR